MSTYAFHPEATQDLEEIWDYIAADSPTAANKVVGEILDKVEELAAFPNRGHRRTDLTLRPIRFINAFDYLIAYVPDERPIWVIAVIHGRRNPRVMAAILRGRQ